MAKEKSFPSKNPALKAEPFTSFSKVGQTDKMTFDGTVDKTALSIVILSIVASMAWIMVSSGVFPTSQVSLGILGGFIVGMATIFKKSWAPYTTPVYAALEGLVLGAISKCFEFRNPGIVGKAVFLTFGTLGALLVAYRSRGIKPTENFKLVVVSANGGIAILYMYGLTLSLFGISIPVLRSGGFSEIVFSVFLVVIASLNLVLDFDVIEKGVEQGAPKYMEWYEL